MDLMQDSMDLMQDSMDLMQDSIDSGAGQRQRIFGADKDFA